MSDIHLRFALEHANASLFAQLLAGVILPDVQKVLPRQKRVVAAGLSRLLVESTLMLEQPLMSTFGAALTAVLQTMSDASLAAALSSRDAQVDADEIFLQDWEEQGGAGGAGFQSSFAMLKSSTTAASAQKLDLAAFLQGKDVRQYLGSGLKQLNAQQPQKVC